MNKTILYTTSIIASALVIICLPLGYWYIEYLRTIDSTKTNANVNIDKFTHCIQVVMTESRSSNKIIDTEKAKDICVHVKDGK